MDYLRNRQVLSSNEYYFMVDQVYALEIISFFSKEISLSALLTPWNIYLPTYVVWIGKKNLSNNRELFTL